MTDQKTGDDMLKIIVLYKVVLTLCLRQFCKAMCAHKVHESSSGSFVFASIHAAFAIGENEQVLAIESYIHLRMLNINGIINLVCLPDDCTNNPSWKQFNTLQQF